jgi:hypothetical protein
VDASIAAPAASGPVRFARYAYGPNRLGYCGPDDAAALWQQAVEGTAEVGLRDLARQFEGAWPYLRLIADANGIRDELDARVVEAYWLGNDLLEAVTPNLLGRSLEVRFRSRLDSSTWHWLKSKAPGGARPMHAFHVLDVFPCTGLLRSGDRDNLLGVMDACRIRWSRVLERDGDALVVSAVPLVLCDGRLALGAPIPQRVQAWRDGTSFVAAAEPGDVVALHWDWACERLSPRQLANLIGWTRFELEIANRTV